MKEKAWSQCITWLDMTGSTFEKSRKRGFLVYSLHIEFSTHYVMMIVVDGVGGIKKEIKLPDNEISGGDLQKKVNVLFKWLIKETRVVVNLKTIS